MTHKSKDDTSPATKADITALREAIERRFQVMEQHVDERFADADRRFDIVDQQFYKVFEYIHAEGKESRTHTEKLADEVMRHFDARTKNLVDHFTGVFDKYTHLYGEKFREHDRRIRALERGERLAAAEL